MPVHARVPAIALAVALALAGCLGGEPVDPAATDAAGAPVVITDPGAAFNGTSLDERPHLHDYWDGTSRIEVLAETKGDSGGTWFGGPLAWHRFEPASGSVVPLGTGLVHVTVAWTSEPQDMHATPELWVKTAADTDALPVTALANGETITMPVTNEQNDLPHQSVSAWEFQFVIAPPDAARPARMDGDVTMTVVVERTLEIPLFPAHADRWNGSTEFVLFEGGSEWFFIGDTDDGWGCFGGCPHPYSPDDGVVVPHDATRVEVTLSQTLGKPTRFGLAYHGASAREYERLAPDADDGAVRSYAIEVAPGMGDGPYARQSQWEFLPFIEEPVPDSAFRDSFSIRAVVIR